jgi:hypothetical protein
MPTKENPNKYSELAKMKIPFVLRDYQSYFESASRSYERITELRSWEAALVSGLCVVILTGQKPFDLLLCVPLLFVIGIFALLEGSLRTGIISITSTVLEVEERLQTNTIDKFEKEVANWTFGNSLREKGKQSRHRRYINAAKEMSKPANLLWHGGLALAIVTLLIVTR